MDYKEYLKNAFPIGIKYGQHRDMQEPYWDRDFANMQDCGIDAVRIHAFWGPLEPREGEYDFAQYDRITAKAGEYGIKVMFTLYLMSAPEWIFHKHSDSRFISANGTVWNSNHHPDNAHGGWPGLCFDSKPFRETVANFVQVFVEHFKGNPNVLAIDIWHEPTDEATQHGPECDWKGALFCYCEHSIKGFRNWLNDKYGSLEALNQAWTRHYNSWDEVEPPHNYGIYTDWLDWKTYRLDSVTNSVDWLNSVVKKQDPNRATSVHGGILEFGHPITHADDHFRLAGLTDMFGCSLYDTVHEDIAGLTGDLMRSATNNGPYWIGEAGTGSGPIFTSFGSDPKDYHCYARPLDPPEIFKLTWSDIARGAKGIFFWAWRPDISTMEHLSLGFTERNGDLTDRTTALKEFTDVFRKYRTRFANAYAPESDICMLYNMDSMIIEGIVSLSRTGGGMVDLKGREFKDMLSFIGCYRLCMKNGIQPDFISKELADTGGLSKYKVLILPYSLSICESTAKEITRFVENGGTVISDAMLGFFTDGGWGSEVCPPHGLDQVFGLRTKSNYDMVTRSNIHIADQEFSKVGCHVEERMDVYENTIIPGVFESGNPAIVVNTYGKGKTVYLGTMVFANIIYEGLEKTNDLFHTVLALADYCTDKEICGIPENAIIEVRRLISEEDEFVFVLNHTKDQLKPHIKMKTASNGEMVEIKSQTSFSNIENNEFIIQEELKPFEVKIFHIKRCV